MKEKAYGFASYNVILSFAVRWDEMWRMKAITTHETINGGLEEEDMVTCR